MILLSCCFRWWWPSHKKSNPAGTIMLTAARGEDANVFGRLRGIVDSDESGMRRLQANKLWAHLWTKAIARKAERRRLDSSSEDDDDNFV